MDERDKKTELLVGLFLFVGLLLLGLLILQFGSVRELFKTTYEITAPFSDGTGIKEGTPVMLGGQKIGKVPRTPELNDKFNGVIIPMEIYHDKKIPSDAKFKIGTAGLLGDSFIEIRPTGANTTTYIAAGTCLGDDNVDRGAGMADLAKSAADLSKGVQSALGDIKLAIADLRLSMSRVNDGALSTQSMEDLKSTIAHLNSVMKRLDEKTLGDETSKDIKATISSLKEASESFNATIKKIEPAVTKADSVMTKLDSAAGKVDTVMATANTTLKSANTAVEDFGKVAKLLGKGSGGGMLPALLHDTELKSEFSMLITNLRKHGVLWYNDEAGEAKKKAQETQERARSMKR
jgi:phospholipid/cholesterol/gamma-HCH transport system substrate-binding protein